jgi:hypothetical protein
MAVTELATARLRLLPWSHSDIDALHQLWLQPDVRRFLWDDIVITRERASEVVEGAVTSQAGTCRIELREAWSSGGLYGVFPMPERAVPAQLKNGVGRSPLVNIRALRARVFRVSESIDPMGFGESQKATASPALIASMSP